MDVIPEDGVPEEWQGGGPAVCSAAFEMDREAVRMHCPAETWTAGRHTLSLYYPIENVGGGRIWSTISVCTLR